MKCKNCNKEIPDKQLGLRDFDSEECKREYRRNYQAQAKRKSRQIRKMINTSYPSDVNKSNPYESTVSEVADSGSETLYESYGGRSWYSLAKRSCCNFEVRGKEGYCDTLFEPYYRFRCKCSECPLGKVLMEKSKGTKKGEIR